MHCKWNASSLSFVPVIENISVREQNLRIRFPKPFALHYREVSVNVKILFILINAGTSSLAKEANVHVCVVAYSLKTFASRRTIIKANFDSVL